MIKPLISICLGYAGNGSFLKDSIESVLRQTYKNFELIIINNSFNDSQIELIESFTDPRIRFYSNKDKLPLYKMINRAVSLSKGELISILHSDDFFAPNFLEEIACTYQKYPTQNVFVTNTCYYYSDESRIQSWPPFTMGGLKTGQEVLSRLAEGNYAGNGINTVYHRNCFVDKGFFEERYKYAAVYEYWLRLAESYKFVYIPKVLTYYRIFSFDLLSKTGRNFPLLAENYSIFNTKLLNYSLLDKENLKKLYFIHSNSEIKKYFYSGLAINSGKYTRKALWFFVKKFPEECCNPYVYLVYAASYFVGTKINFMRQSLVLYIESLFYPYDKLAKIKQQKLFAGFQPIGCQCNQSQTCKSKSCSKYKTYK